NEVMGRDGLVVYLDKGAINVNGPTLKTATVTGSQAHREYMVLQQALRPVHDKLEAINTQISALSAEERQGGERYDQLVAGRTAAFDEMGPIQDEFIRLHPDSYVSWNMVAGRSIIQDPDKHRTQLYAFGDLFLQSEEGKLAVERL